MVYCQKKGELSMKSFSKEFLELYSNPKLTLSMEEYDLCMSEFRDNHEKRSIVQWILSIICFGLGLWLLAINVVLGSVLFIALAAYFNLNSTNHSLMSDVLSANRLQAMLINKNAKEIEAIRNKLNLN
jgi:hypothetical protein